MNTFDQVLKTLRSEFNVLSCFAYSLLLEPNGEKQLYEWLYKHRKDSFHNLDRLVLIQDCDDVYEYSDHQGNMTKTVCEALKTVDISNSFVTILTTNENISQEIIEIDRPNDSVHVVVVPGKYRPTVPKFKDTFCPLPWMHLHITPTGDVLPCCSGDTQYPLGNINEHSLTDIYNNKKFQLLRQGLMSGKHPTECKSCWVKESTGLESYRQKHIKTYQVTNPRMDGTVEIFEPKTFDIRINKLCNLKCRSCSPHLSSAIAQEVQEIYGIPWPAMNNAKRKKIIEELLALLPDAENIYFAGGEPILAPEHFEIVNELVRIKNTDLTLFYNTNFMQLDFRGVDLTAIWKSFSDVTIGASLDAIGPVAEYLRHGTVWANIESNLLRLKEQAPNVKFIVTSTVGFLNVESLIELQQNWTQRGLLSIDKFCIQSIVFDSFFSIQTAPMHHKKRLDKIITDHVDWLNSVQAAELAQRWLEVKQYMWQEDRSYLLNEFRRTMQNQDRHRKESFVEVLPQYADLM